MNVSRFSILYKALRELGPRQLGLFAWYQLALRSGYLRWKTSPVSDKRSSPASILQTQFLLLPSRAELESALDRKSADSLIQEAEEVVNGQVRLFGGPPVPLQLSIPGPLVHWTAYEKGLQIPGVEDIKWVWEPGRFGWACSLARAYLLSGNERYPLTFWQHTETFLQANPPNMGPHWASAQEVALRLMALVFALRVFETAQSATPESIARLADSIAAHAERIPVTLSYARSQNNNHLLTEAAGLYTAGLVLPEHPQAQRWVALGWRWFNHAIQTQIAADGAYIQQSTNYQRLMLQTALWINKLARESAAHSDHSPKNHDFLPEETQRKLALGTNWLLALLDPSSGHVPNLGPNDGAYIFPLSACLHADFQPVLQAASCAFLGDRCLEPGPWDEMVLWFGCEPQGNQSTAHSRAPADEIPVLRAPDGDGWAYLRAAHFEARPGHADQLHLDIWWRGINIAQDAGTYLYNAPPPWNNSLAGSAVHNTLTLNGRDQMTPAGRFLFLDWAQAKIIARQQAADGSLVRLAATHNGYRELGMAHWRIVERSPSGWLVIDSLLSANSSRQPPPQSYEVRLHWLLPDWPWEIEGNVLRLQSPFGWVRLQETFEQMQKVSEQDGQLTLQLVRAGELLYGPGPVSPTWGWVSPTYGYKRPALSFSLTIRGRPPLSITSRWEFPP